MYYLSIFIRDFLPLVLEITLNVLLFIKLKLYLHKKTTLLAKNKNYNKAILKNFKKCDENNTRLAILMCLMSAVTHLLSLSYFVALGDNDFLYVTITKSLFRLSVALKHSINLVIFYRFNKIFKLYYRKTVLKVIEPMTELDRLF